MKIFKKIGIAIVAIIVLLLIIALFIPKDFSYQKSITISAPIDSVWMHTNSLGALDEWSPWIEYNPNIKTTITGTDGTVGAKASWESKTKNVGSGSQTITKIEVPTLFATDLKFNTPYESEAQGFVKLSPEGNKTKVTWGFNSEMPYPFNLMKLTMNMEDAVGKDFGIGLTKLKKLCEN